MYYENTAISILFFNRFKCDFCDMRIFHEMFSNVKLSSVEFQNFFLEIPKIQIFLLYNSNLYINHNS